MQIGDIEATATLTPEDVQEQFGVSHKEAEQWLSDNTQKIEDSMSQAGRETMEAIWRNTVFFTIDGDARIIK